MILATPKLADYDRFVSIFSTKGAEKRREHGSKGATVFRDQRVRSGLGDLRLGPRGLGRLHLRSRGAPGSG